MNICMRDPLHILTLTQMPWLSGGMQLLYNPAATTGVSDICLKIDNLPDQLPST